MRRRTAGLRSLGVNSAEPAVDVRGLRKVFKVPVREPGLDKPVEA